VVLHGWTIFSDNIIGLSTYDKRDKGIKSLITGERFLAHIGSKSNRHSLPLDDQALLDAVWWAIAGAK
jgi:hypothetical protein